MASTTSTSHPVLGVSASAKNIPEGLISPMKEEQLAQDDSSRDVIPSAGLCPSGLASPIDGDLVRLVNTAQLEIMMRAEGSGSDWGDHGKLEG